MRTSVLRLVAIVVLSLHVMPLGLPLFCDTDRRCDGQMPLSMPSGPTIDQTSHATDCATSVFCAVMGTAALILSTPVSVAVSDSYVVAFDVSTFARFDPEPPEVRARPPVPWETRCSCTTWRMRHYPGDRLPRWTARRW